ncbi:iron ABC transporter ATP-binding protein [Paenibacillus albidus]|uniref:Iron ABC transporter ATP-binding protein n=1 Tax=Paenibacillus albidus TaxID=2041023 RepID=A0A917CH14_9BACL|nr:ABC transporter ATP-binding protein [Paenibacillus albidus]GGF88463.1 iron ABC transporter ATP-binding protein [Paenibacillus albidus]
MEIKEVSFSYHRKKKLLEQLSLTIPQGCTTAIIGPNGSGKSTLLGVLAANYAPSSGTVILDGQDLSRYKTREVARKLAVVHQHNTAPGDLTVEKLASFGRLPHRALLVPEREADREALEWALECTDLQDKRQKPLAELSGGERQRVWLALALTQKTPILFLDEPTTYLDIFYQYEMLDLIQRLGQEHSLTVVMVLHDINQAIHYSDHLIAMKDGQVVLEGAPEEIITAESVKSIYGVDVVVRKEQETGLYIIPVKKKKIESSKLRQKKIDKI